MKIKMTLVYLHDDVISLVTVSKQQDAVRLIRLEPHPDVVCAGLDTLTIGIQAVGYPAASIEGCGLRLWKTE